MTFVKNVRSAIEQLNGRPTVLEEAGASNESVPRGRITRNF